MLFLIRSAILVGLIRINLQTSKPFWCAGVYAVITMGARWAFGMSFLTNLLLTGVAFGLASLYFWLLDYFEGRGTIWWLIATGGIVIGLV